MIIAFLCKKVIYIFSVSILILVVYIEIGLYTFFFLVSKEFLAGVKSGTIKLPDVPGANNAQSWDISNLNDQLKLFRLRERLLVKEVIS